MIPEQTTFIKQFLFAKSKQILFSTTNAVQMNLKQLTLMNQFFAVTETHTVQPV